MRPSTAIQLGLTIWSLVSAIPSHGTAFVMTEVAVNEGFLPSGPAATRETFLKYGAQPPFSLAARTTVNGSVKATPTQYDATYLVPVSIGVPANTYTMSLDTGSSGVSVYAPRLGTSGTVTTTVSLGAIVVKNQVVQLSNDASGSSNIVGMSYSGGSFYANAVSQGVITSLFTAALNKGAPGTYGFGYIDTTKYTGSITYVPVNTANGFWEFSASGYAVGTGAFQTLSTDGIVDTGTSLLYLPQTIVTAYYKQVSGASNSATYGGYIFPCSASLPNLTIGIGAYKAVVPGSYLNYAPVDSGSSSCYGGLQSNTGLGFSIFGLVFIKSQFIVFKGTISASLGFAKKA